MKVILKDDLKARLVCAAHNGSVVANDLLELFKKNQDAAEVVRGHANYFATKRKKQSGGEDWSKEKIVFTCCNKDLKHEHFPDRHNPQAPWFTENRAEIEPSAFVGCFKDLPAYSDHHLEYFANALCVASKITVKLFDKMSDFEYAYSRANYAASAQYGESTLHNSCMRHDHTARNAADFYTHFAGAKIVVATDAEGRVLGRAVVWPKANCQIDEQRVECSLLDRIYYSHSFVGKMIVEYARGIGIHLRKRRSDYTSTQSFVVCNPPEGSGWEVEQRIGGLAVTVAVPALKWHKVGAPYLDTLPFLALAEEGELKLCNTESTRDVATCRSTEGYADARRSYCPACGKLHRDGDVLCKECDERMMRDTIFGRVLVERVVAYRGEWVPASFFKKGRPIPTYALYLQIQKLYR